MTSRKLRFSHALLASGWAEDVTIGVDEQGMIASIDPGGDGELVSGIALPGIANVHSHAHQRLMAGLAERAGPGADSFWTWREAMYGFALKLGPEDLETVAAQLYVEMLKSGFTAVGEFQYLHHQPDGRPYANRAELSLRCLAAAERAGVAITMLPTLYTQGGFGGQPPAEGQRRFINAPEGFLEIVESVGRAARGNPLARHGISPHSLRAVAPDQLGTVIAALDSSVPIHVHVAEQVKEVEDCLAFCGRRPVEHLLDRFELSPRWCAIHATHMTAEETRALAATGAAAGLCPTTEANLGDGIFACRAFLDAGGAIAIGSDSHVSVSPAEDLRQLEYSQRLRDRARNVLADGPGASTGRSLFERVSGSGARAIAQPMGAIEIGKRADIVVLDPEHPSLIGRSGDAVLDAWIFSGGTACVRDVYVAGRQLVKDRTHFDEGAIYAAFRRTVERLA
jgi:formimidoylglutamate deiminase